MPTSTATSKLADLPCRSTPVESITCLSVDGLTKVDAPVVNVTEEKPAIEAPKEDKFLNPEKIAALAEVVQEKRSLSLASFELLDLAKTYSDLFEIMWYSQLPCFDVNGVTSKVKDEKAMVKRCLWKGVPVNCASIFKTFPTDRGMCCTFNMANIQDMFYESEYSKMVKRMQGDDLEQSFGDQTPPEWYSIIWNINLLRQTRLKINSFLTCVHKAIALIIYYGVVYWYIPVMYATF
jgi:hypothetical protein